MQYHVIFTVGVGKDREGRKISDREASLIVNCIGRYFADNGVAFTLTRGTGHWEGIHEPVAVFTSDMWAELSELKVHARKLASIGYQTAVHMSAVQVYAVDVDYNGNANDNS